MGVISSHPSLMDIRKASDVRFAKVAELQDFLRERNIPFETDNNKPRLIELALASFEKGESPPAEEEAPLDLTGVTPVGFEPPAPAEEPETKPELKDDPVISEPLPVEPPEAPVELEKEPEVKPIKKGEETVHQTDDRLATPGARRAIPLQELLTELARKGFANKQELADLLEAEVRERKALEAAKAQHDAREQAIVAGELKLDQRIKDNEVIFAQVQEHKKEAADMLERAMKLRS
jgi:hypothetical protein